MSFNYEEFCRVREREDGKPLDERVTNAIARILNSGDANIILQRDEARAIVEELLELRKREKI